MSSKSELTRLLFMVSDYYKESLSEGIINLWLTGLDNFSFDEISSAFGKWMQTEDRMPKISNITEILRGSEEDRALNALISVEKAMQNHGGYTTVVFDDPIIHAVIQSLGGWIKTCRQTENEFVWWRKDFRERYQHFDQIGLPTDIPVRLAGIFDHVNLPHSATPQKPAVIGDYEKAIGWVSKLENPDSLALGKKEYPKRIAKSVMDGI